MSHDNIEKYSKDLTTVQCYLMIGEVELTYDKKFEHVEFQIPVLMENILEGWKGTHGNLNLIGLKF